MPDAVIAGRNIWPIMRNLELSGAGGWWRGQTHDWCGFVIQTSLVQYRCCGCPTVLGRRGVVVSKLVSVGSGSGDGGEDHDVDRNAARGDLDCVRALGAPARGRGIISRRYHESPEAEMTTDKERLADM